VGVIPDLKSNGPDATSEAEIYVPMAQDSQVSMRIFVRATGDPMRFVPEVRALIDSIDPNWPLYDVRSLEDVYDSDIAPRRSQVILFGSFGTIALLLSAIGVYGSFTYTAMIRSRELAIRMALGADQWTIMRLVLRNMLQVIASGLALGIILTLLCGPIIRGSLYGITPLAPRLYLIASWILGCVALLCGFVPAYRASRSDPNFALRQQ
jgi:ABC-type antimicrobial peptide transport system permease subunit